MKRFQLCSARVLPMLCALHAGPTQAQAAGNDTVEPPTPRFQKIADGVYFAVGTGSIHVMSNSMVVIGDTDVLVVDSHVTPAANPALSDSAAAELM